MAHPYWPLFDLRVRTPMLELRPVGDEDAMALAALAAQGVHPPDFMPFNMPWTQVPSPQLERNSLQWYWRSRAEFSAAKWDIPFAVVRDGEIVGTQGMGAQNFPVTRAIGTGSWLGMAHQGQGTGKEMRTAILHLAFAGLGADVAYSSAFDDNPSSCAVSRAVGYEDNGDKVVERLDRQARQVNFKMTRAMWEARRRDDIVIEGLEPCLEMFGID